MDATGSHLIPRVLAFLFPSQKKQQSSSHQQQSQRSRNCCFEQRKQTKSGAVELGERWNIRVDDDVMHCWFNASVDPEQHIFRVFSHHSIMAGLQSTAEPEIFLVAAICVLGFVQSRDDHHFVPNTVDPVLDT